VSFDWSVEPLLKEIGEAVRWILDDDNSRGDKPLHHREVQVVIVNLLLEIRPDKATPVCRSDACLLGTQSFPLFVDNCSTF
jgi:hypothetical protein